MKWVKDDAGDLINLDFIESIQLSPIFEGQEAPEGHTHEILAVTSAQESYRLFSGSIEDCESERSRLTVKLGAA